MENAAQRAVIADIGETRSAGKRVNGMADMPTERGVPTKTGHWDRWTHQAVARILSRA